MKTVHRYQPGAAATMGRPVLLLIALFSTNAAHGASRDIERAAGAAAGIYAGIYVHELGHAAAFRAAGAEDVRIRIPGPQCKLLCGQTEVTWAQAPGGGAAKIITTAGFVASNLVAEGMLRHEAGARSGFGQGFIATNLYSNVAHVATYYTKIRGKNGYRGNDIDMFELAGGNPHLLSAGLVAYSLYSVHRMRKKNIPVMFVGGHF